MIVVTRFECDDFSDLRSAPMFNRRNVAALNRDVWERIEYGEQDCIIHGVQVKGLASDYGTIQYKVLQRVGDGFVCEYIEGSVRFC